MGTITAFLWGAWEFRSDFTRSYDGPREYEAYDWGREIAHRLTFRYYDWKD